MKQYLTLALIFVFSFLVYFGTATRFTFHPKWVLDYFNPLTQSILNFHLDISNPPTTHDLANYHGKWYAPWGILPVFLLLPAQLLLGRFVPTIYLTLLFASLDVVLMYLLLLRLKKEFYPNFSYFAIFLVLVLFTFGTVHFYVGTLGSVWHVDQMITNVLGTLGLYISFKKKRRLRDYALSAWVFGLALLGRATLVLLVVLPVFLYFWQYFLPGKISVGEKKTAALKAMLIFGIPLIFFSFLFFLYNYVRFNNPLEFGYSYIKESPNLAQLRETYGTLSLRNVPRNLWYMLLEVPSLSFDGKFKLGFNLNGNSIFFLTPPLLAIFLTKPFRRKRRKFTVDPYVTSLWSSAIITILPSLMIYASGWMQFGYRYSLDVTALLVLLSVMGMEGKLNILYIAGTIFSVIMYTLGINALM